MLISMLVFQELSKYVDEYTSTYEPDDQLEWSLVLGEIKSFLEADAILNILDADSNPMVISHRFVFLKKTFRYIDYLFKTNFLAAD